ncbi:MAG: hypothetical protein WD077_05115 [Bacteroidia bacterium]
MGTWQISFSESVAQRGEACPGWLMRIFQEERQWTSEGMVGHWESLDTEKMVFATLRGEYCKIEWDTFQRYHKKVRPQTDTITNEVFKGNAMEDFAGLS